MTIRCFKFAFSACSISVYDRRSYAFRHALDFYGADCYLEIGYDASVPAGIRIIFSCPTIVTVRAVFLICFARCYRCKPRAKQCRERTTATIIFGKVAFPPRICPRSKLLRNIETNTKGNPKENLKTPTRPAES